MKIRLLLIMLLLIFRVNSLSMTIPTNTPVQAPIRIILTQRHVDGLSLAGGCMASAFLFYCMHMSSYASENVYNEASKLEISSTLGILIVFVLRALLVKIARL